jgi:hypothetical protein
MTLQCFLCEKSVSNEVPDETIIRAALICPECVDAGRVVFRLIDVEPVKEKTV